MLSSLWILGLAWGVPFFLLILFLLPEDAYGEEDVKTFSPETIKARSRTQILVLGDIGRSPRMQYHALSIAKHGVAVDLIGYLESDIHPGLKNHKYISIFPIDSYPRFLQTSNRNLFLLFGPLKVLYQSLSLWQILGHRTRPTKWLLVQNPPSIPVLAIAATICWLRKTKLVIDWHNYGYSILALKLGPDHLLVKISKWYERFWAGSATANFVVSDAMGRQLKREFGVKSPVIRLHDRPVGDFRPLGAAERLRFLGTLDLTKTFISQIEKRTMKVLVSSTSWTPDEDFSILLDALVQYSALATSSMPQLPELLVVITGKGPQKEHYLQKIAELKGMDKLEMVTIKTAWLSTADYAGLLGSADLGVSLHKSSSGVDLPMKVVDMFGAGLAVVGWSMFESWPELVKEGVNGRGFGSVDELVTLLVQLMGPEVERLVALKQGAMQERERGWDQEWNGTAGKLFGLGQEHVVA